MLLRAALAVSLMAVLGLAPFFTPIVTSYLDGDRRALRIALRDPAQTELRLIYAERHFKPIWLESGVPSVEARQIIERMADSRSDNLDPGEYRLPALQKTVGQVRSFSKVERAQFELELTRAYGDFVSDLRKPLTGTDYLYTDPALAPARPTAITAIRELATRPHTRGTISEATRMNLLYLQYRSALAALLETKSADTAMVQRLKINLERVRALPPYLGDKFVFVDVAAKRLWLYENGRPVDSMKVVVGAPHEATPAMAALIRYVVFNPYWNVPPDISQRSFAPRIAANRAALSALRMDAWSDFSEKARRLEPEEVDWVAAADGRSPVWLRQRPGPGNAMGSAKFMLPNEYGIYLHDTPDRQLFDLEQRALSAGCVRVENYRRLARWLHADDPAAASMDDERRVDLKVPVPVYIAYLTVVPVGGALELRQDFYQRDPSVLRNSRPSRQQISVIRAARTPLRSAA